MVSDDTQYLADTLAEAIRQGFSDLGDRIGGGSNPENVSMSLKMVADALGSLDMVVADALAEAVRGASQNDTTTI